MRDRIGESRRRGRVFGYYDPSNMAGLRINWLWAVLTFYGVVIGILIFAATSAMRERVQPDSVTAFTGQTNAALPVMHRSD